MSERARVEAQAAEKVRAALDQIAGELHLYALGEIEPGPAMESIDEAVLVLRAAFSALAAELVTLKDALERITVEGEVLVAKWHDAEPGDCGDPFCLAVTAAREALGRPA